MKICYIILGDDENYSSLGSWQKKTWVKEAIKENSNYYYLLNTMDEENHILGWNLEDTSASNKYRYFFKNFDVSGYDYVFFCDTQSYVFEDRLGLRLNEFNKDADLYIGRNQDYISPDGYNLSYMYRSGFALSMSLYNKLRTYVSENFDNLFMSNDGDISIGMWIDSLHSSIFKIGLNDVIKDKNNLELNEGTTDTSVLVYYHTSPELYVLYYYIDIQD